MKISLLSEITIFAFWSNLIEKLHDVNLVNYIEHEQFKQVKYYYIFPTQTCNVCATYYEVGM